DCLKYKANGEVQIYKVHHVLNSTIHTLRANFVTMMCLLGVAAELNWLLCQIDVFNAEIWISILTWNYHLTMELRVKLWYVTLSPTMDIIKTLEIC
ncbi:hypothetical protein EJ110_NYTH29807, partial [Nymphaea thermarum]